MLRAPKLLSVIIPAYHQERTIREDVRQIDTALSELENIAHEIIVVVDGTSEDRTFKKAEELNSKRIRVVGYVHNHGKGYAVRYGMARCRGDIIAFIDAGGDIKSEGMSMALEHFRWYNADIIVGSKRHPASKISYPWYRKIISFVYQLIVKILFGLSIRDSQVGLKLFRRQVLEDVLPRLLVKRFAFDIEILAVARSLGYSRIFEAPIELDFSAQSTITSVKLWREIASMLWDTMSVFYRLKILHYYTNANRRRWRYDAELDYRINLP